MVTGASHLKLRAFKSMVTSVRLKCDIIHLTAYGELSAIINSVLRRCNTV